jgi:membrane protein YdbS with pleckstrin-like domain
VFFDQPLKYVNVAGMAVTLLGTIIYVWIDPPKSDAHHHVKDVDTEDVKIFSASGQLVGRDSVKDV